MIADPKTSKPAKGKRGDVVPGRLRSADIRNCVLDAAYEGVLRDGFRALTVEAVSAKRESRRHRFIAGGQTRLRW